MANKSYNRKLINYPLLTLADLKSRRMSQSFPADYPKLYEAVDQKDIFDFELALVTLENLTLGDYYPNIKPTKENALKFQTHLNDALLYAFERNRSEMALQIINLVHEKYADVENYMPCLLALSADENLTGYMPQLLQHISDVNEEYNNAPSFPEAIIATPLTIATVFGNQKAVDLLLKQKEIDPTMGAMRYDDKKNSPVFGNIELAHISGNRNIVKQIENKLIDMGEIQPTDTETIRSFAMDRYHHYQMQNAMNSINKKVRLQHSLFNYTNLVLHTALPSDDPIYFEEHPYPEPCIAINNNDMHAFVDKLMAVETLVMKEDIELGATSSIEEQKNFGRIMASYLLHAAQINNEQMFDKILEYYQTEYEEIEDLLNYDFLSYQLAADENLSKYLPKVVEEMNDPNYCVSLRGVNDEGYASILTTAIYFDNAKAVDILKDVDDLNPSIGITFYDDLHKPSQTLTNHELAVVKGNEHIIQVVEEMLIRQGDLTAKEIPSARKKALEKYNSFKNDGPSNGSRSGIFPTIIAIGSLLAASFSQTTSAVEEQSVSQSAPAVSQAINLNQHTR